METKTTIIDAMNVYFDAKRGKEMAQLKGTWESIEKGLLMSAKYSYDILQRGDKYKVIIRGVKSWNSRVIQTRYYKTNPQNINFGLTVRSL